MELGGWQGWQGACVHVFACHWDLTVGHGTRHTLSQRCARCFVLRLCKQQHIFKNYLRIALYLTPCCTTPLALNLCTHTFERTG